MHEHRVTELKRLKARIARYQGIADRTYDPRTSSLLRTMIEELQQQIDELERITAAKPAELNPDQGSRC